MQKLTKTGQFKSGLLLAGIRYTEFILAEADVGTMIDAETEAGSINPVAFSAAMLAHQLQQVKAPDGAIYAGPFTLDMLKRLRQADFAALRAVQVELETLGESEPDA